MLEGIPDRGNSKYEDRNVRAKCFCSARYELSWERWDVKGRVELVSGGTGFSTQLRRWWEPLKCSEQKLLWNDKVSSLEEPLKAIWFNSRICFCPHFMDEEMWQANISQMVGEGARIWTQGHLSPNTCYQWPPLSTIGINSAFWAHPEWANPFSEIWQWYL